MLKPNDEYRDAVEVLELALDLRDGASEGKAKTTSPQKLDNARRIRESLDAFRKPSSRDREIVVIPTSLFSLQGGGGGGRKGCCLFCYVLLCFVLFFFFTNVFRC